MGVEAKTRSRRDSDPAQHRSITGATWRVASVADTPVLSLPVGLQGRTLTEGYVALTSEKGENIIIIIESLFCLLYYGV